MSTLLCRFVHRVAFLLGVAIYGTIYATDAPKLEWANATYAQVRPNTYANHYSHENTFFIEAFGEDADGYETDCTKEENEELAEQFRDICRRLKRLGYGQIEALTNEEAIREHLEWSEPRRFTENGEILPSKWWAQQ